MNQVSLDCAPVSKFGLNQGQEAAADAFFQFLMSDAKEFGISGPAGTGKTFLMGHMIDQIMPNYQHTCKLVGITPKYTEVVMTATTNKATEQLAHSTKRPCSTIQSFMNLKVQDDYATGTSKLIKTKNWVEHKNKVIFIDECSFIDSALYYAIHEGTVDCKIVYVGDHCQLAPVAEVISPVYRNGVPFYELTQPMRNSGQPALMNLCNQLRHTVETGEFLPIQLVPGVIDYCNDDEIQLEIDRLFATQTHDSRILAYTNNRVIGFNDHIRELRNLPPSFTVGELLVNNNALHMKRGMLSIEKEVEIVALSDQTQVIEIEPDVGLEVCEATIKTAIGEVYSEIQLPVDRDHFLALIKHYQRKKDWTRYFFLKNKIPDFRPQDASTFYKAQGSTYDTVIIDLGNLSSCNNPNQVARQLYVGVSRPRQRIMFYGKLNPKYGSLVA